MKYSVVIRTLGNAGEKFESLLISIHEQTLKPEEIIVVLPYGYPLDFSLGNEKIIYTEKGMVNQRVVGINVATSPYLLIVDDDVCFKPNFIECLEEILAQEDADVVLPIENQPTNVCSKTRKILLDFKYGFLGQRFVHSHKSNFSIKIAPTGGHSIISKIDIQKRYLSQSGNFQCFFIKRDSAKGIHFENEKWLEDTGYAIYDDQVFFYKAFLLGHKIVSVPSIQYKHLNAGVAHHKYQGVEKMQRKLYGNIRNRTIFWYRFLYSFSKSPFKKIILIFCYLYGLINTFLFYSIINLFKPKYLVKTSIVFKAAVDALKISKDMSI